MIAKSKLCWPIIFYERGRLVPSMSWPVSPYSILVLSLARSSDICDAISGLRMQ
jgi:hypothetical protein